jgi:hypothetical protein
MDLGPLSRKDQKLLGVAFERFVEDLFDAGGRMDVRLVGRERAVLAVALASTGEREREVAGEGDPAHSAKLLHLSGSQCPPVPKKEAPPGWVALRSCSACLLAS